MRHRTPRARGQPLRAVCPRNVVRLFRPKGRNWMPRIYSGHPTVRLPQAEAWAERERVPSGHNCRRQLATGRPEQIQEPGTAVPGTPIFANNAKRGGPPLESPCRQLSLVLSFASKESTSPLGAAAPPSAPESARQAPGRNCFRQSCLIMPLAGAFRSPPAPPRFVCQSEFTTPRDCTCTPRRSRRVNPRIRKLPTAKITYNTAREFSFSPHHRSK